MSEHRIPIILDTDPGHDDAFAIMCALGSEKIDLKGLTTICGNSVIENTTRNALRILERTNRTEVPVSKGISKPMCKPLIYDVAKMYHGESGLDGPEFEEVTTPLQQTDAVEFIAKTIRESEEKVVLVPVGPLTNIAAFILSYPELVCRIDKICIMGGLTYTDPNSATAFSEYNIFQDPEAANVVFQSGLPVIMHSINSTGLGKIRDEHIDEMEFLGNAGKFGKELMLFYRKMFQSINLKYYNICDSHAICYLIDPTIYTGRWTHVEMDLTGKYTRAMTISDLRDQRDETKPANCFVIEDVNFERYKECMFDCIRKLG